MMKLSPFLLLSLLFFSPLSHSEELQTVQLQKPNIILVNVDNHSKFSLGYYGNTFIETPHIDRLLGESVRFESYFTQGRCTGARSALITGRYHARNGVLGTGGAWGQTREDVRTVAHGFAENGYQTAMFGKWHIGDNYPLRAEDRGFQEVVSVENGGTLRHLVEKPGYLDSERVAEAFRFRHNGVYKVYEGFRTDIWFSELDRYVSETRKKNKPFFVYLATVTAHGPHYGPEDLREYYLKKEVSLGNSEDSPRINHAADIGGLDRNIGRMMSMLEREGILDNTLIIYTSDGPGGGPATLPREQQPKDLGLSSNPLAIRFPQRINQGVVNQNAVIGTIDMLPTLMDLAGIELDSKTAESIDGQSFATFTGLANAAPWEDRTYVFDQQSTGRNKDMNYMITLQPYCETRIYLPGGEKVEWRHGTLKGSVDPSVVETAKTEYEAWVIETLREMPLGAFVASGPNTPRVYVTAYPILDGPAGEGTLYYYLVDILESGSYQIARDNTDRYGLPRKNPSPIQQPLFISKQIKKEPFPRDYDEATGGYRILKHTFDSFFNTWEKTPSKEGILELEAGRYLLSSSFLRQHKASTIRIEHQD